MPAYSAGGLSSAGSTTLPVFALVGATTVRPKIFEIGVFNTTATAVALKLVRMTTAGTPGAALTMAPSTSEDPAALALARGTYSGTAPTFGADLGYRCILGAAVGSGFVWTFPDPGLGIPAVAAAGIACIVENGAGQPVQYYIAHRE